MMNISDASTSSGSCIISSSNSCITSLSGSDNAHSYPTGERGGTDAQGNPLAFTVSDDQLLMRFLILGSETGNFYATPQESVTQNVECVTRLIQTGQGEMVVEKIVEVVKNGRCIRVKSALLGLALCCCSDDPKTKSAAYRAVQEVCNIPTHLFMFVQCVKTCHAPGKTAGWGRGLRNAVQKWYNAFARNPQRLAMLVTKYRQREGWAHSDLLVLSHVKPVNDVIGFILRYVRKGLEEAKKYYMEDGMVDARELRFANIVHYLEAVEEVRHLQAPNCKKDKEKLDEEGEEEEPEVGEEPEPEDDGTVQRVVTLVRQFELVREHIPTPFLRFVAVWESMLEDMPMMALLRNLNKMTLTGLLGEPRHLATVLAKLGSDEAIRKSKIHPYSILLAWFTYRQGRGAKGKLRWNPVPEVVAAMEQAFYTAFGNVTPTNKRILIALDISGSMSYETITGGPDASCVTPRIASTAMCLITLRAEPNVDLVAFESTLTPLSFPKDITLDEAYCRTESLNMGRTNCSLPMIWAKNNDKKYDAFIVYTDSENWFSPITPAEALRNYRQHSGITTARLAVVAMSTGKYTLADPQDIYMLDVVGFDTETPAALQEFIAGTHCE